MKSDDSRDSDKHLVQLVLSGRSDAFDVLMRRYLSVVHGVAFAHTGNVADAEDVAQDTFVKAYQKLDTIRDAAKIGAWLTTIARRSLNAFKTLSAQASTSRRSCVPDGANSR